MPSSVSSFRVQGRGCETELEAYCLPSFLSNLPHQTQGLRDQKVLSKSVQFLRTRAKQQGLSIRRESYQMWAIFDSQIKNATELTFLLCYSSYCRFLFRTRHSTLGKSRWWRIRTWSSLLSIIHQNPIYKWNNSHRTEYILNTSLKKKSHATVSFCYFYRTEFSISQSWIITI